MDCVAVETNGDAKMEDSGTGEVEGKSIMAMIAAGEFDAGEEAGQDVTMVKAVEEPVAAADIPAVDTSVAAKDIPAAAADNVTTAADNSPAALDDATPAVLAAALPFAQSEHVKVEGIKKEEDDSKDEAPNAAEEIGSEDDKYKKEDAPRRVFVKHIDRKKSADDVEDYFFDNYADVGLEDVYTCLVFNARSNKKLFFGNVILTFDTAERAKVGDQLCVGDHFLSRLSLESR